MNELTSLLAVVPVSDSAKQDLRRRMSEAHRSYHGIGHLALLWNRHRRYAAEADLDRSDIDRLVGSAIAFHDAIYVGGGGDNEARSADLWRAVSQDAAVSEPERLWVARTIEATSDHLGYAPHVECVDDGMDVDERARIWMLDLDLTPLGEEPAVFDANTERLRDECPDLPFEIFENARLAFLRRFQAAPRIYRSPVLAAAFEAAARRNIARHLAAPLRTPAAGVLRGSDD